MNDDAIVSLVLIWLIYGVVCLIKPRAFFITQTRLKLLLWIVGGFFILPTLAALEAKLYETEYFASTVILALIIYFIYRWRKGKKSQALAIRTDTVSNSSGEIVISNCRISQEIANLLWFSDGKYQNYDPESAKKHIDFERFRLSYSLNTDIEPSVISVMEPIAKPQNPLFVPPMGYYPQYCTMTPEQRYIYLHWLSNVDAMVDIGYVFTFYYGLERHLVWDNVDAAFDMVLRLKKVHNNHSFQSYSSNALLAAILYHKRADLYKKYITQSESVISDLSMYVKFLVGFPVLPEELIANASRFNFTNNRYIKAEYELFYNFFTEGIKAKTNHNFVPWDGFELEKCQMTRTTTFANTSLNIREITIPNVLSNTAFFGFVSELLKDTHERVKEALKKAKK